MAAQRPSVARNVHVVSDGGGCIAGIVSAVDDADPMAAVVYVFPATSTPGIVMASFDDSDDAAAGTWHWPERVQ